MWLGHTARFYSNEISQDQKCQWLQLFATGGELLFQNMKKKRNEDEVGKCGDVAHFEVANDNCSLHALLLIVKQSDCTLSFAAKIDKGIESM